MEDREMRKILDRWAENEKKLLDENKELKKELSILRELPTPEDFEEEFKKGLCDKCKLLKSNDAVYTEGEENE